MVDRCLEPRAQGGDIPPMGGKRTLRSIKKQSVPHILAVVVDAKCVGVSKSERWKVLHTVESVWSVA
jgi:hypothetical protein